MTTEEKIIMVAAGAAVLASLFGWGKIKEAFVAMDRKITGAVREGFGTTYCTGPSHADLVNAFGDDCAGAIEGGGILSQAWNCPFGWQKKVKSMSSCQR